MRLTFDFLRTINTYRCEAVFKKKVGDWTAAQWGCALAGEVGELCNLIKKSFRGDGGVTKEMIADEIADVAIYLDLLAAHFDIDLEAAIIRKFNVVSARRGSDIVIDWRSPRIGERTETVLVLERGAE